MADQASAVPFDEAPVTTRYWLSIILFAVTGVVDFFDFFVVGFLVSVLAPKWHLTFGQTSIMLMSAGIGAMLGALASGFLADRFGRKPLAVAGVLICGLSSGAIALIPEDGWIFFAILALLRWLWPCGGRGGSRTGDRRIRADPPQDAGHQPRGRSRRLWRVVGIDHGELSAAAGWLARARRGRLPADHPRGPDRHCHAGVAALADQQGPGTGSADQHPQTLPGRRSILCAAGASGRKPRAVCRFVCRATALLADGADLVRRQHRQLWRVPVGADDRRPVARRCAQDAAKMFIYVSLAGVLGRTGFAFLAHRVGRKPCGQLMGYGIAISLGLAAFFHNDFVGSVPLFLVFLIVGALFFDGGFSNLAPIRRRYSRSSSAGARSDWHNSPMASARSWDRCVSP